MKALAWPVRRPIGTAAIAIAGVALGLAALPGIPLSLAPDVELPRLVVRFVWPEASPEEMEALVTSRAEAALGRLRAVEEISSLSLPGVAFVQVEYVRGTDLDLAEVEASDALAGLRDALPPGLDPPDLQRVLPEQIDPGAFFVFRMTGDLPPEALRDLLDERILPALTAVPGVAGTQAYGGSARELRVDVDRAAVERGDVSPADVVALLDRVGGTSGAGVIRRDGRRVPVVVERPAPEARALRDRPLDGDGPRRSIEDVGGVTEGWEEPRTLARLDGRPSVQGVLEREPGTNVVTVAREARRRLEELAASLPDGTGIDVVHDESESIGRELRDLAGRAGVSALLVLAVLVLSMRAWRAPLVVMSAVVLSAVATFVLFRFAGLGFNLVTLSGLALSIGLAVDNAIVLFENVAHRARGVASAGRRNLRTIAAAREVLFPLLAGTATTAVVMTPFLYLEGELRDVYAPFVLSVVLSLVASLGVALTVVPAATAWALAGGGARSAGKRRLERGFDRLLRAVLRRPIAPILASAVLLGASLWVFAEKVPKGSIFAPQADTKLRVSLGFPPGTDLAHADTLLRRFEDRVLGHEFYRNDWISSVDVLVRADLATLTVDFPTAVARTLAPISLQEELTQVAATIAGADVSVSGSGPGFQRARSFVSPSYLLRVTGPEYERVRDLSFAIAERLRREPRVRDVDPNGSGLFVEDARELVIRPDREALARVGLTATDLVRTLRPAVADELDSRRLSGPDGELRARVRFTGGETLDVADLRALRVPTPRGPSVAVADVASIEERALPGEIRRRDQRYERSISFDYRGPRRVGDRFTRSIVENTELPTGYLLEDGLGLFLTRTERRDLNLSIALAVGLVALVSAALFESVSLALIATLCIPLAFVGIPFVFWLSGETFDRTAYVGLILLAGIAVNNALLLVHRAGHLRWRGASRRDAARRATVERVRPVLLTTATSVAGLVPLVWQGGGTGAGTWRAFALAGIAGLSAAALFTLLVIPCLFVPLARFRGDRSRGLPGAFATVPPNLPRMNLPSTKGVAR